MSSMKPAGLLLVAAVVTIACGGKLAVEVDDGQLVPDAGAPLGQEGPLDECATFARAHAVFTKTCLGYDEREPSLARTCRELLALPGTSLTATDVIECTTAVEKGMPTCALPPCSGHGARAVSPSAKTPGSLPSGSSCMVDFQCSSGECHIEYGKTCGTCLKTRFIRESCHPPDEPCLVGLHCVDGTCQDGSMNPGEACDASTACGWDLYCNAGPSGTGVCAHRRENGEPCSKTDECLYRYCDGTQGKCVGHPAVGTSCIGVEAPCGLDGVLHCSENICQFRPVFEGGNCSEAPCDQGMRCIDDVCRKPAGTGLGEGERCFDMYCAAGLACAYVPCSSSSYSCYDRICVSRQPGDPCAESTCSPGAFCDGTTCRREGDRGDGCRQSSFDCPAHLTCVDGRCVGYHASLCR